MQNSYRAIRNLVDARQGAALVLAAAVAIGLLTGAAAKFSFQPIDFRHYMLASAQILAGVSPYGTVEFFAPPWFSFLLGPLLPLPEALSSGIWLFINLASVYATAILAIKWLGAREDILSHRAMILLSPLLPSALYVFLTGQVTALMGIAVLGVAVAVRRQGRGLARLATVFGLMLLTLKPHLMILPGALLLLELARRKRVRVFALLLSLGACVLILSFILLPRWPAEYLASLRMAGYKGGQGYVASGYVGLRELGLPSWIMVPISLYPLYAWWRGGLQPHTLSVALAANLVVVPYSRVYDHILLLLPAIVLVSNGGHKAAKLGGLLAAMGLAVVDLSPLALLTPLLILIGLLIARPPWNEASLARRH